MHSATLGYVSVAERGGADHVLTSVAAALGGRKALIGVVQINTEYDPARPCHMDLSVLGTQTVIRISQFLGAGSQGCRLDAAALEAAVGMVATQLQNTSPDLLIINKFGKQEGYGRGFRPLIGQALAMGVPVLTAVSALNLPQFLMFAAGMAAPLPPNRDAVLRWLDAA
jgi:hypothetical protein